MRNSISQRRAIALRRNLTNAEQHLWRYVRRRQIRNFEFRRQIPVGPYLTDFVCLEISSIIEVDGGQHDRDKSRELVSRQIVRFSD